MPPIVGHRRVACSNSPRTDEMFRAICPFYFVALTFASGWFNPVVTYVSFSTPTGRNFSIDKNSSTMLVSVSQADDTPMEPVVLPQVIPYYGRFYDRIYVAPNGHVQVSPIPPCGCCYCDTCSTKFSPYEEGIIAAFLTDFDPSLSVNSTVSYKYYNNEIVFIYDKLQLYGSSSSYTWSFRISLAVDGAIRISYDNIPNVIANVSKSTCWISGLMAPMETGSVPETSLVTAEQLRIGTDVWKSQISGVYPPTMDAVQTGEEFHACPLSTSWCGSPSVLDTSETASAPLLFNLSTLSAGCRKGPGGSVHLEYAVYLSVYSNLTERGRGTVVVEDASNRLAWCEYTSSTESGTAPLQLTCDISQLRAQFTFPNGYFYVAWRAHYESVAPNLSYALLDEVPPIPVSVWQSGMETNVECALNQPVGSCSACDVCAGRNLTGCMALQCTADEAQVSAEAPYPSDVVEPLDSLYTTLSCNTSCTHVFDYHLDINNKCCPLDELDCMGVCDGGSIVGTSKGRESLVCCGESTPVDCSGVCGGSLTYDTCNVCGGNDTGIKCSTNVSIVLDSSSSDAFYTFYHGGDDIALSQVRVSNNGNSSILVKFSLTNTKQKNDPLVWLPTDVYDIVAGATVVFNITSSLSRIYDATGNVTTWDVKSVLLE